MLAYDLIGFQTEEDRDNFARLRPHRVLGLTRCDGDGRHSRYGAHALAVFPIGIDADEFASTRRASRRRGRTSRGCARACNGEKLVIGVDRLDYSKGLINRIHAFDRMLTSAAGAARARVAAADRDAVARADRGLRQSAGRAGGAGQRRQRPPRRGRLDADPLSQQRLSPDRAGRASIASPRSGW